MGRRKSTTCFSRRNDLPLTEYDTRADAHDAIVYEAQQNGRRLNCYRCEHCALWHLAPSDRCTPGEVRCGCTQGDGGSKLAYDDEAGAEKRSAILYKERGLRLRVYRCPDGAGWHLTKAPR